MFESVPQLPHYVIPSAARNLKCPPQTNPPTRRLPIIPQPTKKSCKSCISLLESVPQFPMQSNPICAIILTSPHIANSHTPLQEPVNPLPAANSHGH